MTCSATIRPFGVPRCRLGPFTPRAPLTGGNMARGTLEAWGTGRGCREIGPRRRKMSYRRLLLLPDPLITQRCRGWE